MVDQSWALESGIQFKESGIPLTIRIQNPSSIEKKNRNQYVLDHLISDALYGTTSIKLSYGGDHAEGFRKHFEDPIPW